MKNLINLLLLFLILSCSNHSESFIPYIEGYWEIDEVTLPGGLKKAYTYNDTIDYIEMSDSLIGNRRKLRPGLNGGFETSGDLETFHLKIENDSLNVYYETPFAAWKETILSASQDQLLIINQAKVRYLYKRYQPIDSKK